jgi:preprotein translocase subunit SecE
VPNTIVTMQKIKVYLKEVYNELIHKVTWPTWSELQNSAVVVMVASLIIALIIYIMDVSFTKVMEFVYSMFY